jgi:hypothetical protein
MNTTLELRSRPASSQGQKREGERAHRRRLGRDGGASLIWRCSSKRISTSERQGRRVRGSGEGIKREEVWHSGPTRQPRPLPVDRHASTYAHSPFVTTHPPAWSCTALPLLLFVDLLYASKMYIFEIRLPIHLYWNRLVESCCYSSLTCKILLPFTCVGCFDPPWRHYQRCRSSGSVNKILFFFPF